MNPIHPGPTEDLARASRASRSDADRLTFALMLPVSVAIGLLIASPLAGLAWRVALWAAGADA